MAQPLSESSTANTSFTVTSPELGHALQSLSDRLTHIDRIGNKIEVFGAEMETLVARHDHGFQVMSQQEMVDRLLDQSSAQKDTKADSMAASSSSSRGLSVNAPEFVPGYVASVDHKAERSPVATSTRGLTSALAA